MINKKQVFESTLVARVNNTHFVSDGTTVFAFSWERFRNENYTLREVQSYMWEYLGDVL